MLVYLCFINIKAMTLNHLYDIAYKLQVREHFARNLCVCVSRETFIKAHAECQRKNLKQHFARGPRYFHELNIDGVAVIWSDALKGDMFFTGAEHFAPMKLN
jgi:hypothetical protein